MNIHLLSDAEIAFYKTNGFVAPRKKLFADDEIQKLKDIISPLIYRKPPNERLTEVLNLINRAPDFLDFIAEDKILNMIEKVIGPHIGLKESSAITKFAHSTTDFKWHSDFNYSDFWEELIKINSVVLVIALTPSTSESGCVQYVPKTHLERSQRKHQIPEGCDPAVSVTLAPGDCSLHDVHVMHCSEPNRSHDDRILLTFRFFSTDVAFLGSEAANYLKKTAVGRVHLRGRDERGTCAHSIVKA